jgi:myo-inositol 2-dehydrogenase/D-chiro-inositol 1-dehydrogenase
MSDQKSNQNKSVAGRRDFIKAGAVADSRCRAWPVPLQAERPRRRQRRDQVRPDRLRRTRYRRRGRTSFNTTGNVKLTAVADAFQIQGRRRTAQRHGGSLQGQGRGHAPRPTFHGLDAYKKAARLRDIDLVVIATPPGFRPQHFETAVASRASTSSWRSRCATDAPGVRRVLAAVEESKKKNLMVGVGLQRRHEGRYVETVAKTARRRHRRRDHLYPRLLERRRHLVPRQAAKTRSEMRLPVQQLVPLHAGSAGDQICEQHIHNLDVGCWAKDAYPVECNGMGGGEHCAWAAIAPSRRSSITPSASTPSPDGTKMYEPRPPCPRRVDQRQRSPSTAPRERLEPRSGSIQPGRRQHVGSSSGGGGGHQQEQHDLIAALIARRDLQRRRVWRQEHLHRHPRPRGLLQRQGPQVGRAAGEGSRLHAPASTSYTLDSPVPDSAKSRCRRRVPVPHPWPVQPVCVGAQRLNSFVGWVVPAQAGFIHLFSCGCRP